jgi:hypothetical protein
MTDLLRLLGDGGLHSLAEIARRLRISEALAAAMTADLDRRGYLAAADSCSTACAGCGIKESCVAPGATPTRLLALTPKGRRAARA